MSATFGPGLKIVAYKRGKIDAHKTKISSKIEEVAGSVEREQQRANKCEQTDEHDISGWIVPPRTEITEEGSRQDVIAAHAINQSSGAHLSGEPCPELA